MLGEHRSEVREAPVGRPAALVAAVRVVLDRQLGAAQLAHQGGPQGDEASDFRAARRCTHDVPGAGLPLDRPV